MMTTAITIEFLEVGAKRAKLEKFEPYPEKALDVELEERDRHTSTIH
jgi:hypothetical protein